MFRWLTAGESHGPQLTVIIEGLPAGLEVSQDDLRRDLARRQGGHGRGGRQQIETDQARIVGGIRGGFTLGSPVALVLGMPDPDPEAAEALRRAEAEGSPDLPELREARRVRLAAAAAESLREAEGRRIREIRSIVITANLTPRKCLGFKTPFQAILKELGKDVQIRFSW